MKISDYCPFCDFGMGEPDDCLCDENCGEVGCSGNVVEVEDDEGEVSTSLVAV